jgi:hypothetical protein
MHNLGNMLPIITVILVTIYPGWVLYRVFTDRLSYWARFGWCFFVMFLPVIGPSVYLVYRGRSKRNAPPTAGADESVRSPQSARL